MTGKVDLSVRLTPQLKLNNPVIAASGTFGYGNEYSDLIDIQQLGAIICKGTTLQPRDGNPQPRIMEVHSGIMNWIGLQNIGIEAVILEKAPLWDKWEVPVLINIAGNTIDEYAAIASRVEGIKCVSGIEINISCPNVKAGGMQFGTDPKIAASVTKAVRANCTLPVITKLSPNVTDIVAIALAVEEAGADAVSLINTVSALYIDMERSISNLNQNKDIWTFSGGLSGPAIKHVALNMVYRVARAVKIPVIGCGGIMNAVDAMEFMLAGATAVQVGTATFKDPAATIKIIDDIQKILLTNGISSLAEFQGKIKLSRMLKALA